MINLKKEIIDDNSKLIYYQNKNKKIITYINYFNNLADKIIIFSQNHFKTIIKIYSNKKFKTIEFSFPKQNLLYDNFANILNDAYIMKLEKMDFITGEKHLLEIYDDESNIIVKLTNDKEILAYKMTILNKKLNNTNLNKTKIRKLNSSR